MSEIVDRMRSELEKWRGRGLTRAGFELADVEALIAECDQREADVLSLIDENQGALDV